jgi:hypothetical protein
MDTTELLTELLLAKHELLVRAAFTALPAGRNRRPRRSGTRRLPAIRSPTSRQRRTRCSLSRTFWLSRAGIQCADQQLLRPRTDQVHVVGTDDRHSRPAFRGR